MRILIVEDDVTVSHVIEAHLKRAGLDTLATASGEEAVELAALNKFDLVLLDLNLPDMQGHEVVRAMRAKRIATPILVLTGEGTSEHMLRCFGLGADDYLEKPFNGEELVARIRAIIRRAHGHSDAFIRIGGITVNMTEKVALVDDRPLNLTTSEYQILELLALRKGATVTKEAFMKHLYSDMDEPNSKIIDVFICKLRKKIEKVGGRGNRIQTVWGSGYMLCDPGMAKQTMAA